VSYSTFIKTFLLLFIIRVIFCVVIRSRSDDNNSTKNSPTILSDNTNNLVNRSVSIESVKLLVNEAVQSLTHKTSRSISPNKTRHISNSEVGSNSPFNTSITRIANIQTPQQELSGPSYLYSFSEEYNNKTVANHSINYNHNNIYNGNMINPAVDNSNYNDKIASIGETMAALQSKINSFEVKQDTFEFQKNQALLALDKVCAYYNYVNLSN